MKRIFLSLISIFCIDHLANAQSGVAINTSGSSAHSSAMLDVSSTNKGILIPRIALLAKSNPSPVSAPVTSLMVYNTASAGTGTDAVYPGYYVWNGSQWNRMSLDNDGWSLWGNAGTNASTNFIGTIDAQPFRIFTNNGPAMYFHPNNGFVGIGDEAPSDNLTIRLNVRGIYATPSDYSGIQLKPVGYPSAGNDMGLHIGLDRFSYKNARIMNYDNTGDLWFGLQGHDVLHLKNQTMFVGINEDDPQDNLTIRLNPAAITSGPDPYSGILINPPLRVGAGNNYGLHLGLDNSLMNTARLMNNENGDLFLGTNKYGILYLKGSNLFTGINTSAPNHTLTVKVGINGIYSTPYEGLGVITPDNPSATIETGLVVGSDPVLYANKGIWNYDYGKIAFGTNNLERVTITKDGDVGIGTINPATKLHLHGGSAVFTIDPGAGFYLNAPVEGSGRRMLWWGEKSAFRVGSVNGSQWDGMNIGYASFAAGADNISQGDYAFSGGASNWVNAAFGTAFGYANTITHQYTAAIGTNNYVDASNAIALGTSNNISSFSDYAMAFGTNITLSGFSGLGFGNNLTVSGNNATAIGNYAQAAGMYSTAIGYSLSASGGFATAMGYSTSASGISSVAMGESSYAIGNYSTAIGNQNFSYGHYSVAAGQGLSSKSDGCVSLGIYNDITDLPVVGTPASTDRIFQLGNGTFSIRSNAITVLRNGNMGIGILTPAEKLHVVGNIRSSGLAGAGTRLINADANGTLGVVAAGTNGQVLTLVAGAPAWANAAGSGWSLTGNSGTSASTNFIGTTDAVDFVTRTSNTERMRVSSAGNVGIGNAVPRFPLTFAATLGNKISLWDDGVSTAHYGIGIQSGILQLHSDILTSDIVFGYGSSASLTETVRFKGTGNVGIGISAPTQRLDVQGGNARINNTFVGDVGHGSVWAGFSHSSQNNTTGYALLTANDGSYTFINKANTGSGYIGFRVGNADVAVISNAGRLGVGTTAPATRLEVAGTDSWDLATTEGDMRIGNGTYRMKFGVALSGGGAGAATIMQYGAVGGYNALQLGSQGVTSVYVMGTGNVGIGTNAPTQKLHVIGNILASGTITPSDIRYKKNIHTIGSALKKLQQINGVTYQYNPSKFPEMGFTDAMQMGFIAQEVEKVFPELVVTDNNGYKAVDYPKITPVLVEAIKDQQKQIDELNKRIEKLEKLISAGKN